MTRLVVWLDAFWHFVREVSGEAALERRMQQSGCHDPRCAARAALEDVSRDRPRCC